jgi:hypothetical protein
MSVQKIKEMFSKLTSEEQGSLLSELSSLRKKKEATDTSCISDFAARHQKEYGKDITFSSANKDGEVITIVMQTVFGKFTGKGSNQKIAKIDSVKQATDVWDNK